MNPYDRRTRISCALLSGYMLGVVALRLWIGESPNIQLAGYWLAALFILICWFFWCVTRRDKWERENDWGALQRQLYDQFCNHPTCHRKREP